MSDKKEKPGKIREKVNLPTLIKIGRILGIPIKKDP